MPRRKEEAPGSETPTEIIMPWDLEKFLEILTPTDGNNVHRFAAYLPATLLQDNCCVTSFVLLESPYIQTGQLKEVILFLTPDHLPSAEKINPLIESYFRKERFYDKDFKWRFREVEWQMGEIPYGVPFRLAGLTTPERRKEILIWPRQSDNVERIRLLLRHFNDELSFETLKKLSKEGRPFVWYRSTGFDERIYPYLEKMERGKAPVPSCYPQLVLR